MYVYLPMAQVYMRDLPARSSSNKPQVVHVLDGVLEPLEMRPGGGGSRKAFVGLTAGKFLRRHQDFDLGEHSIR